MLSSLSDAFFFLTGFPLSGIYSIPTEVGRLIFTTLSYQSYFKFKAQCCFHLEIFLHEPFTRPLQAMVCQDLSNFSSLLQRSLAPPSHHPTQTPAAGQSLLPMDCKAAGKRLGGSGGRNQIFMLQKSFSWDTQLAWLLAIFFSLDGIDSRIKCTH